MTGIEADARTKIAFRCVLQHGGNARDIGIDGPRRRRGGGVVSSEPSKGSSGGFLTSRYSLVPMTSDGTRTGASPLRHYLRSYVDAIAASFEAAAGAPGGSPKRRALERFLRALDDLGAAADGLGRSDPPEQPRLPL